MPRSSSVPLPASRLTPILAFEFRLYPPFPKFVATPIFIQPAESSFPLYPSSVPIENSPVASVFFTVSLY